MSLSIPGAQAALAWDQLRFGLLGLLLLAVLGYIFVGYKGLKMSSFNEDYAAVLGISVAAWNLSLMAMVSFATVVSFESVGAILVVALLVVPAATAYLLVEKLHHLLMGAAFIALVAALGGYACSRCMDTSIAGTIATLLGVQFLMVLLVPTTHFKTKPSCSGIDIPLKPFLKRIFTIYSACDPIYSSLNRTACI